MGKYRVGVRPSRLRPGEGQVSLKARVEFVEPLGDQTLIHCRVGDLPLVATAEASWTAKEGSEVVLGTTVDALYWFDEEGNAKYVTEGLNTA
ncbi:hypothetical protein HS1genome_1829 [Sulfodiicoccus acidiphilus]|nr:TOBE domain-containing protein [Sulfodiicoccus acidiphilus]BBD73440.1 hypothetical protein HS1genome_1829 [Sulfodiicoccus acidiphilus]